jgi:uncharacterized protein
MTQYIHSKNIAFTLANLHQLVFEVTDACNLKCKYCAYGEFYEDYDEREDKMLPTEKAIRLIDYLAVFWNSERNISVKQTLFISFYGGEPLLNMSFIQAIVDHVENKLDCPNCQFVFSMTTNALLLHKYMDYLKEHGFVLLISLDGNKENTGYRVNRVGGQVFNRIVNNVDKLKEKYPDYFKERVNFNAVLHNKNSVEEIYWFFKEKYDKIPSIGELNNVGIRKNKQDEFKRAYRNARESLQQSEHYEKIEQDMFIQTGSYQRLTLFLHRYSGFVFKDYTDLLFDRNEQRPLPTGTCTPFSKKMYVTVNGKILPCERIGHQFALGEITDTEIKLNLDAIAEKYNAYYAKFENQCSRCKNTKSCIQCMFNVLDLESKPVCHGYMNEEVFRSYFNAQMHFLEKKPDAYKKIMEEVFVI